MRFLIDEQLPPGLADWLAAQGHQAHHLLQFGHGGANDQAVADIARDLEAVLVTKDADFGSFLDRGAPPVVWIRLGNVTNRALIASLSPVLPEIIAALEAGEWLVEVR